MATTKKPAPKAGRKKSKLTIAADEAAREAKRKLLLRTLRDARWNLTAAARELEVASASDILRAIRETGLDEEYEAARVRGDVSPGSRTQDH